MEVIYFTWLVFILFVVPASIPLVLPYVLARGLVRYFPKWTFTMRWSLSLIFVVSALSICAKLKLPEWILRHFAG